MLTNLLLRVLELKFPMKNNHRMTFPKAGKFVNREKRKTFLSLSENSHFGDFSNSPSFSLSRFIYIFTSHVLIFTHKNFLFFLFLSVQEENSRMKNIFQVNGLVFVCIYTTLDAFFRSRTLESEKENSESLRKDKSW